jgi:hypothetical protein
LPDADRHLVHDLGGQMAGGIAAEQAEYARAAQHRIQVRLPGHDMEVNMREALRLFQPHVPRRHPAGEQPARLGLLRRPGVHDDAAFANLYFAAAGTASNPAAVPLAWRPLAARRAVAGIEPVQFALSGMNAHINHDLPLAVVSTCTALAADVAVPTVSRCSQRTPFGRRQLANRIRVAQGRVDRVHRHRLCTNTVVRFCR